MSVMADKTLTKSDTGGGADSPSVNYQDDSSVITSLVDLDVSLF